MLKTLLTEVLSNLKMLVTKWFKYKECIDKVYIAGMLKTLRLIKVKLE